ncbi:hypothetical protein RRG08_020110 [Elysia crispata]|uniref:Uncharacterized protein n=1 Tax=Elysia crispata TaxID=231223 RepID=A0AAE1DSZ2_9GAST|nr:hypothetical protein RRG08_020110 [Elysia crispata]
MTDNRGPGSGVVTEKVMRGPFLSSKVETKMVARDTKLASGRLVLGQVSRLENAPCGSIPSYLEFRGKQNTIMEVAVSKC